MKAWLVLLGLVAAAPSCAGAGWSNPQGGLSNQNILGGGDCYKDTDCPGGAWCVANKCRSGAGR